MIVGRIRTIDIASRLHGDEFAIFVADTDDYPVAQTIMKKINQTWQKKPQNGICLPSPYLPARYWQSKEIPMWLCQRQPMWHYIGQKETHDGGFAHE